MNAPDREAFARTVRLARDTVREAVVAARFAPASADAWRTIHSAMATVGEKLGRELLSDRKLRDATRLAAEFGVQLEVLPDSDHDGSLVRRGSALVASVGAQLSPTRRRASIAHELGHSLFWTSAGSSQTPLDLPARSKGESDEVEASVWVFARGLLLPRAAVELRLGSALTAEGLLSVAKHFRVSPAFAAWRVVEDLPIGADWCCLVYDYRGVRDRRPGRQVFVGPVAKGLLVEQHKIREVLERVSSDLSFPPTRAFTALLASATKGESNSAMPSSAARTWSHVKGATELMLFQIQPRRPRNLE